jgi:hypothetical protein
LDRVARRARIEGVTLGLIGEADVATDLGRGSRDQPAESRARPVGGGCGGSEHKALVAVDSDQLDRREPDRERVLADASAELAPDLAPGGQILRARDVEVASDLVEVDADWSSPAAPSVADVVLLDDRPAVGAPPFRGVGGVGGSWVQGFVSRARDGGVSGGVVAGFTSETPLASGPFAG